MKKINPEPHRDRIGTKTLVPGDESHVAGRILEGYDGLVLLREHDPPVQERRDDVRHQNMNLEIFKGISLDGDELREAEKKAPWNVVFRFFLYVLF